MKLYFSVRKGAAARLLSGIMIAWTVLSVEGAEEQIGITNCESGIANYELRNCGGKEAAGSRRQISGTPRNTAAVNQISLPVPLRECQCPSRLSTSFSTFNCQFSISRNPFRYSAYYTDTETDFYYLKARYYSPLTGNFTSRDSYDLPNRFACCDADPVNNTDPDGHIPKCLLKLFSCCIKSDKDKFLSSVASMKKYVEKKIIYSDTAIALRYKGLISKKRSAGYINNSRIASSKIDKIRYPDHVITRDDFVDACIRERAGNCIEQAGIFVRLFKKKYPDLKAWIIRDKELNHAFVIVENRYGRNLLIDAWRGIPIEEIDMASYNSRIHIQATIIWTDDEKIWARDGGKWKWARNSLQSIGI